MQKNKQQIIDDFKMSFSTSSYVDKSLLIHRGYSEESIQLLIDEGILSKTGGYDEDGAFANAVRYKIN